MAGVIFSKASGVNDSIFGKSQEPIKMLMEKAIESFEDQSCLEKIFAKVDSDNYMEKFTSMTSMGNFEPVGENGAYPQTEMQEGYSKVLEADTWKNKFVITQEMVEDNKVGLINARGKKFTQSYLRTREEFGAALIGNGITGASVKVGKNTFATTGADKKAVFATDHPSITQNTEPQSNKYAGTFSNTALAKLEVQMQNFKDDNGKLLSVAPDTIIIPNIATLKADVFAAIGADKDPATANNGFNFTFGRWTVCVWAYLNPYVTGGNVPWILMDKNYNEDYLTAIILDRIPLTVRSYIDNDTDANIFSGRSRFTGGFNDWRGMIVGGITGGSTLPT